MRICRKEIRVRSVSRNGDDRTFVMEDVADNVGNEAPFTQIL